MGMIKRTTTEDGILVWVKGEPSDGPVWDWDSDGRPWLFNVTPSDIRQAIEQMSEEDRAGVGYVTYEDWREEAKQRATLGREADRLNERIAELESERDESNAERDALLKQCNNDVAASVALRKIYRAKTHESLPEFVARLARERDEAIDKCDEIKSQWDRNTADLIRERDEARAELDRMREGWRKSITDLERELEESISERDALLRQWDTEVDGRLALREKHGAKDSEGFSEFVGRLASERDEAKRERDTAVREALEAAADEATSIVITKCDDMGPTLSIGKAWYRRYPPSTTWEEVAGFARAIRTALRTAILGTSARPDDEANDEVNG